MRVDEIEQLVRAVRPGTTIEIVRITVPAEPTPPPSDPHLSPVSEAVPWTHEAVVEWVHGQYVDAGLKPREWAALLDGVSANEIERAIRETHLACYRKPDGRDHGAYMIRPADMQAYLVARPARRERARKGS